MKESKSARTPGARRVAIAGGGLAGLACGLSLARAGWRVTLVEASERLGGKAGSRAPRPGVDSFPHAIEHGPHFFPAWYRNVRRLMELSGTLGELVDLNDLFYLFPVEARRLEPRSLRLRMGPSSLAELVAGQLSNLVRGPVPWYDMAQSGLSALDLITAHRDSGGRREEVSLAAFLRSRWYATDSLAWLMHTQVLRGSSISGERVSARSIQQLLRLWFRYPAPFISMLGKDLGAGLIRPLERELEERGEVRRGVPVAGVLLTRGRVAGLRLGDGETVEAEATVLAVPVEVARRWLGDEVCAWDPELARLHQLETAPMAALHLAFKERLPGIPRGMIYLWGSPSSMNFIDLSQVWRELAGGPTVLSLVISDATPLHELSPEEQVETLLGELRRYVPAATADRLLGVAWQPNDDAPLFLNTVGSWEQRPRPEAPPYSHSPHGDLYLVGDYVRSEADLTCMEGAVLSGLRAAEAVARRAGAEPGIPPVPLEPYGWPQALAYRLAKAPLSLGALVARLARRPPREEPWG